MTSERAEAAKDQSAEPAAPEPIPRPETLHAELPKDGLYRILSLDGGGAKGIYTLGVLKEIEGMLGCPLYKRFDLIFGTSTGSIIGALLAIGCEVDQIHELYKKHVVSIMAQKKPRAKTAALERLAGEVFKDRKFDAVKTGVGIVTTKWIIHRPMVFKGNIAQAHGRTGTFAPGFGCKIGDAVQASCSAYPYFDRKTVTTHTGDKIELVDGGYCANNPTLYAIADAIGPPRIPPENMRVVSVGVGEYPEPKPKFFTKARWSRYLLSVQLLQRTLEINTQSMDQLRAILFKDVPTIRVSEAYTQPEMATDLFEHDLEKLNILWQRGRESFAHQEPRLKDFLCRKRPDPMSIGETQLETWSKVGSQAQSKDTYATIRNALTVNTAPFAGHVEVFLQGSYGNDTNVFGKDSDVDIVAQSDQAYFYDITRLTQQQQATYGAISSGTVNYPFQAFRNDVIKVLKDRFGNDVDPSHKKAIKIRANGNRRGADVLVCQDFRRYRTFIGSLDDYDIGIAFLMIDGKRIENYPKAHSVSLTAKHQLTNGWLKPTIRIFKNIRNRLINDGKLQNGVAPSYYLEGLLWNAPEANFGKDYNTTIFNCLKWMTTVGEDTLSCPNGMSGLIGDNQFADQMVASQLSCVQECRDRALERLEMSGELRQACFDLARTTKWKQKPIDTASIHPLGGRFYEIAVKQKSDELGGDFALIIRAAISVEYSLAMPPMGEDTRPEPPWRGGGMQFAHI